MSSTLESGGVSFGQRRKVNVRGSSLALLTFQTLGIIYSDIGTSPLYVLNGIWPATGRLPPEEDIIGGISAIIWSLTLLPLLKYVIISLRFSTREGEGGTFALFQSLYPPANEDHDADRVLTGDIGLYSETKSAFSHLRDKRQLSKRLRWPLLVWCLIGTALTMADGVFTPAVSVTSAVGGIAVAEPDVTKDVVPISIVFLLALFVFQRFGTSRVGLTFAPISSLWFMCLTCTGIYNITRYPGIFRALDPSRAVMLFVRTREYDILAGVLLSLTGCEAIFANLGQFNDLSIRISFSAIVYPSLLLAYLGQGARLITGGEEVLRNIFYNSIPGPKYGGLFWFIFVLAILATLVASQAMISAAFSLAQQLINMKCFPPLRMHYTSNTYQGQVYIPMLNWTLMVATIIIVVGFSNTAHLANAYGFAVATVMFSTSVLLALSVYYVKNKHWIASILFLIVFGSFDGLFWGAALKKVPEGAWVPLLIGAVLMCIMILWTWGKNLEDCFDRANRKNLKHFITENYPYDDASSVEVDAAGDVAISEVSRPSVLSYVSRVSKEPTGEPGRSVLVEEKREIQRIACCAIFHKFTQGSGVPHTFIGFIRQWPALPRVIIFLSVCVVPVARVPEEDRYVITKVRTFEGIYGVTYYLGFRDDFDINVDYLIGKLCASEVQANPNASNTWLEEIRTLVSNATHIVPHYHVVSKKVDVRFGFLSATVNFLRKWLIEDVYRRLATMFPQTANWLTPADEIIHVGITAFI
ncbi:hypothetical protein AMATHDRAFT_62055 [Amanita thiersii Skay4041]|uniref:Potassium transporter n=1 Tax=Amanita thiersii Skay4041 TaxID=703135 RepID=A0A2A9NG15_9AGAR|nr:hypothetical protein AMATHDRAFT_62055 [Amanita thiersii Skay4041]